MLIILTGKGGVGKTMVSSLLVKAIAELKANKEIEGEILAVDADPASNFANALGIKATGSVGDIREDIRKMLDKCIFPLTDKEMYFDGKVFEITAECNVCGINFEFIEMGRPEGYECYCALNDMLKKILKRMENAYKFIVVDCEAGLEHISRKTTTKADIMLIVTDTSNAGFKTAVKINDLAQRLGVKKEKIFLVVNKFNENFNESAKQQIEEKINTCGIPEICIIPYDEEIAKFNLEGKPLIEICHDSTVYNSIRLICKILLP
ncbi:Cobyrinic acid ac-diamide synthase [groundwater metagenome]|uniref:Cobyrinic acid ac-diamide synthase n=1 Tax=groundwater metagenome TaxID=717931 RepID=A0A098ECM0_9ZZZZ